MRRRDFIELIGGMAATSQVAAQAQEIQQMRRIGVLTAGADNPNSGRGYPILLSELRKLGFVEGQNLIIEQRRTDVDTVKLFTNANELVAAKIDVLVVSGPELPLQAAAAARPAVPIVVMAINFDPLARGYISSLSRPGGNITGMFYRQPELAAKQLELLVEAFPNRKLVGILWDQFSAEQFAVAERTAFSMGLSLRPVKLENPPYDWNDAFRSLTQYQVQTLLVLSSGFFASHREQIARLAIQNRLPTMFTFNYYVEAGGLLSYGVSVEPVWRRAASYVAKVLRGAKPADLPAEQITNFELSVNLKTAKTIGATLPTSILLRADEVIE